MNSKKKYYIYEFTLHRDYGYMGCVRYFEKWAKVSEADTLEAAIKDATKHADEHYYKGRRESHPGGIVGFQFERECVGGAYIIVDPLPYVEVGYYIFTEDLGDVSETYFKEC